MRLNKLSGFTLMELLMVVSLAAAAFGAMSLSLMTGMNVSRRLYDVSMEAKPALFFEKLASDLRNHSEYQMIPFDAKETSVSFASPSKAEMTGDLESARPVQVAYLFNYQTKTVSRIESDPVFAQFDPKTQVIAENVKSLKFSYPHENEVDVYLVLERDGKPAEYEKKIFLPIKYAA